MRRTVHILSKRVGLACKLLLIVLLSLQTGITGVRVIADGAQAGSPPNILFIIMDDVGIDQMRVFGYEDNNQPFTPNIDTIAHAGVRFRNAWAMPECSPSRVSFFTGRYPLRTGVLNISATRDLANSQASPDDHGNQKDPTDPRARQYLTTQQTTAAIDWVKQQSSGTPWMVTLSYSAAHLPAQQAPRALLPMAAVDSSQFDCTKLIDQRLIYGQMIEAMDQEIGRFLIEVNLATRTPDGQLVYRPEATNTTIVIVGDNGSYFSTVRLPFDPTRGKGTVYQTGVWVPLIVSGPMVNQANVDTEVDHMVNAAVDVFQLFGEAAGIDVRQVVPPSHALDARSLLPYLTVPGQKSIRKSNLTQTGTNLQAPGPPILPCIIQPDALNVCTQIFPFQALCETEGGTWYGPGGAAGPDGLQTCCQVKNQFDPDVTLLAHDAWAVRDDQFKLVRLQVENCSTNQLELQYEFYRINDPAPDPKLDRQQDNLLTSTSLPPQGLTPDDQKHFDILLAELLALLRSEPACPGDGNLDQRVNFEDLQNWQTFADICKNNQNQCSSVYDLNFDAITDSADRVIIEANFGRRCGVRGFLR